MKLTRQKIRRIILQEMMHSEPDYDDSSRPSETDSDEDMFEFAYEQDGDDMINDAIENELLVFDPVRKIFGLPLGEYDDATGYEVYDNTEQLLQDILMQDFLRDTYAESYDDSRLEQIASDAAAEREYDQELSRYNYDDNY
jgi:hypothetical protein